MMPRAVSGSTVRRVPATQMKPSASAPASTASSASLPLVIPQILIRIVTRRPHELPDLPLHIRAAEEPLSHENRIHAGRLETDRICSPADAALADDDAIRRNVRAQGKRRLHRDPAGLEVPVINSHDGGLGPQHRVTLPPRVDLDEGM